MEELIKNVLDEYIDKDEISGASVLVRSPKLRERYVRVDRGLADRTSGRPYDKDTIIRLYSMSKPVTSAAVMILIERGLLDRLEFVKDFMPSFGEQYFYDEKGEKKKVSRDMTIGDLLDMTGGLSYPDEETPAGIEAGKLFDRIVEKLDTPEEMNTFEVAEEIGKLTLAFDPGSAYRYSTSADVLGAVIEKKTGMKFSEFLKEELFKPLEMGDTGFYVPEDKQSRLARTYVAKRHRDTGLKSNEQPISDDGTFEYKGSFLGIKNRMETAPRFESGGAGLASTLEDYMKFAEMLENKGTYKGKRILSPETVRFMTERKSRGPIIDGFHDAFGLYGFTYSNLLRVCEEPGHGDTIMAPGEYGWDGWPGPYFANIPSKNATILVAMQMTEFGTFSLTHKLINIIMSNI